MEGAVWLFQWGDQLSSLAENLVEKIPDEEDWNVIRHSLQNISSLFRRGDIKSGARAFYKIVPFVQRALASTEKVTNMNKTYDLTATIAEHFLVEDTAREEIEQFMKNVKSSIDDVRSKVEKFTTHIDAVLEQILLEGRDISVTESIKLAFQMNRISAEIHTCEDKLKHVRQMIDELDTHVASKTFLAVVLSYIAFFGGIILSSTGQIPLGAACLTAATASRKSAQGLHLYRKELIRLDAEHKTYQSELTKWRNNFRSEQINFLLLFGIKRMLLCTVCIFLLLFLVGKSANFLYFAFLLLYLVVRTEETNSKRHMTSIGIAVLAMVMEYQNHNGLPLFNGLFSIILCMCYMGFLDF